MLAALADDDPYIVQVVGGHVAKAGYFGQAFAYGLDVILDVLEKRRDAPYGGRSVARPAIQSRRCLCATARGDAHAGDLAGSHQGRTTMRSAATFA